MASTSLVPEIDEDASETTGLSTSIQESSSSSIGSQSQTSAIAKNAPHGLSIIRKKLKSEGFTKCVRDIIMSSWRDKTKRQYNVYLRRYQTFCGRQRVDPLSCDIHIFINFLHELYEEGLGYSTINTARSAISSLNGLGSSPVITRFIPKYGMFRLC